VGPGRRSGNAARAFVILLFDFVGRLKSVGKEAK